MLTQAISFEVYSFPVKEGLVYLMPRCITILRDVFIGLGHLGGLHTHIITFISIDTILPK